MIEIHHKQSIILIVYQYYSTCLHLYQSWSILILLKYRRKIKIMIKMVMTDIDGTLIKDGTLQINPEYYEVIEKLVEKGIVFVIASGRHMVSIKEVFAPVMDKLWIASQNGNVVSHNGKSKIMKPIPQEWGKELWEQLSKFDQLEGLLNTPTNTYCPFEGTPMHKLLIDGYHYDTIGTGGWSNVPQEDFSMMTMYHPENVDQICKKYIKDKWEGKLEFLNSGKYWIDVVRPGANKGTAMRSICEELGISREETIAFGDNINDIAMLEYAGKGYAVDTARKETKEAADEIIPGYAEDGVLKVLKTFLS